MARRDLSDLDRLLVAARRGDAGAADELFGGIHRIALGQVRRGLPDAAGRPLEPEDVAAEAMVDLVTQFRRPRAGADARSLIALLRRIVAARLEWWYRFHRAARRDFRRAVRLGDLDCAGPSDAGGEAEAAELREWIRDRVGVRHARVASLREEGRTIREIASAVGLSERTVRRMMDDVRAALAGRVIS